MFNQFGEVDDDIFYIEQIMRDDLVYTQAILNQDISDYEKERWLAEESQFSGLLSDMGYASLSDPQVSELSSLLEEATALDPDETISEPDVLMAGFDFGSNLPILAIIGIGLFVASRRSKKKGSHRKRKRSRKR